MSRLPMPVTSPPRRAALPRHEFRVGRRELLVFTAATVVVWALTFVFGVLVGRELGGSRDGGAVAAPTPPDERPPPGAGARKVERPAAPSVGSGAGGDDRLTFYKTLTAPTLEVPSPVPPRIEERIVPHDAPVSPAPTPPAPQVAAAPAAGNPGPVARGGGAPRPPAAKPETPAKAAAPVPAPKPVLEPTREDLAGRVWTVQVSSFRSRGLADDLRGRLAAKGFDAYLVSVTTEDGRVRHRVRVGGFTTRAEAERVAGELRSERDVNPFVTTRAR